MSSTFIGFTHQRNYSNQFWLVPCFSNYAVPHHSLLTAPCKSPFSKSVITRELKAELNREK